MRLLDPLFGWEAVEDALSPAAFLSATLKVEAALARAQAELGLIPGAAAAAIAAHCHVEAVDMEALGRAAERAGNLAIPLIQQLRERVAAATPEAADFVHWGATSQDILDTALVLQLGVALGSLQTELDAFSDRLAALAREFCSTPVAAHTWMQQAVPTSFGLRVAGWLDAVDRHRLRLQAARRQAAVLQFGGAAGNLAALHGRGLPVAEALAFELGLELPAIPWHSHRDRLAEVATVLGLCAGTLGKLARDLALQMETECGELRERTEAGRGGSSSMPHKRNPVGVAVALAAAIRVPALAGTMLTAMVQEHERGLGGWQAEWEVLPEIVRLTGGALHQLRQTFARLEVDPAQMRRNLDLTRGLIYSEAVEYALAARLGRKRARALVAAACERLRQGHHDLYQELAAEPELAEALPELAPLFDPTHNLGESEPLVRRALAAHDSTPATRTLQLAHQKIRYELKGSATAPVVILAHALGANLTLWDAQTVALTPHFRVLRYDLRGHGQTSAPAGDYTLDQLGNDVVALLDSLGLPHVHFCGISLGGLIGLWLGLHAPERLHSLVLANTAARIGSEQSWNERILQVRQNGLAPLIEPTLERWLSPATRHRCPGVARAARAMIAATPAQGYLGCCAVLRDTDLRQQIAAIRLPTLIIAGREDESTPTQQARFLAAEIPGARFAELDTAHISSLGAAPQFNDELRRFWGIGE